MQAKIEEENGNPPPTPGSAARPIPTTFSPRKTCSSLYAAQNASHLISDMYKDAEGKWYGILQGAFSASWSTPTLERLGLEAPADWADLLKPEYKDLIWLSNYNTAGTAKLVVNTMIQKCLP